MTDQLVADGCARLEARAAASAVLAALTSALLWWAAEDQADLSSGDRACARDLRSRRPAGIAMSGRHGSDGSVAVRAAGLTRGVRRRGGGGWARPRRRGGPGACPGRVERRRQVDVDAAAGRPAPAGCRQRRAVGRPGMAGTGCRSGPDRLRRRRTHLRRAHRHRTPDLVGAPARMPETGSEATSRRSDRPARLGAVGVEADPDPVQRQPAAARGGVGADPRPGPVDLGRADHCARSGGRDRAAPDHRRPCRAGRGGLRLQSPPGRDGPAGLHASA